MTFTLSNLWESFYLTFYVINSSTINRIFRNFVYTASISTGIIGGERESLATRHRPIAIDCFDFPVVLS